MSIQPEHRQLIRDTTTALYGLENLETVFITGSVAADKARPDSDIDIFICHSDNVVAAEQKRRQFTEFYFNLHAELGRVPDDISPGEVLSLSALGKAVTDICTVTPTATLSERKQFDAICWAGMLVSRKDLLVPFSEKLNPVLALARGAVHKWAADLSSDSTITEATGEDTDADKILRKTISCPGYYDAH